MTAAVPSLLNVQAHVQAQKGAGVFQSGSDADIGNCTFVGNFATQDGEHLVPCNHLAPQPCMCACISLSDPCAAATNLTVRMTCV